MTQLRAIIIDDDRVRREAVRDILPDYISSVALGYGEGALDYLKPDAEGIVPDVVIMYGDDSKSLGLYTYDWMINKSGNSDIALIPVVIMTEDEFSDRAMEFLEIGDVVFYEGEVEESRMFSVITQAIEAAEFAPEPVTAVYEETKSIDRLAGHTVKKPEEDGKTRAVVLDMDTKLQNLEAALMRGKKRSDDIRNLLGAAQKVKEDRPERRERKPFVRPENLRRKEEPLKQEAVRQEPVKQEPIKHEPIKHEEPARKTGEDPVSRLRERAMNNPYGAFGAQGSIKLDEPARRKQNETYEKKTVVVVDSDVKTRKLCMLFLTHNYRVVVLDSGIRTVDYFVKNRADLLIINPLLPGMNGTSTVHSVHMQPGCANVPVMYIVGDDFTASRSSLLGPGVVGILNKPIKRETIAQAVEGLFGSEPDV